MRRICEEEGEGEGDAEEEGGGGRKAVTQSVSLPFLQCRLTENIGTLFIKH